MDESGWVSVDACSRRASRCRHRNATGEPISERWEFDGYDRLEARMRRDIADLGWWFDTAALTPEETAGRLVREMAGYDTVTRAVSRRYSP